MSSKNTAMPESNMSEKKVVHGLYRYGRCIYKLHGYYDSFVKTIPYEESCL